jgi:hypothetical protein
LATDAAVVVASGIIIIIVPSIFRRLNQNSLFKRARESVVTPQPGMNKIEIHQTARQRKSKATTHHHLVGAKRRLLLLHTHHHHHGTKESKEGDDIAHQCHLFAFAGACHKNGDKNNE